MKPIRSLALSVLSALAFLGQPAAAQQAAPCGDACMATLNEGQAFAAQGKFNEALDKYRQAQKAEPGASLPVAMEGSLVLTLSAIVKPELKARWRDTARTLANRALALGPTDSIALETLRKLDDDAPALLHAPNAAAAPLLAEAESQFGQQHFQEALKHYEAAMQADPQLSAAWLGAGDCYYGLKDYPKAETMFRRAAEIEPRNSQAWRYLSDALAFQGKIPAAEAALVSAIEADPSQRPNWTKLASLRAMAGNPLAPLAFRRGVRVAQGADGNFNVNVEEWVAKETGTADGAVRIGLGTSEAGVRIANAKASMSMAPFEIELQSWQLALKIADELKAGKGLALADPGLRAMQGLAKAGQLEPAILLLQFRQAYRPQLEAWVAAHPGGVKAFIDRYGLQP